MAWSTSDRRSRLPANWLQLREEVFRTKGRSCHAVVDGRPCNQPASDIDHIVPSGPDTIENLQPLCRRCHKAKSSSEGWQALNKKKKEARARAEKKFGWTERRPEPEAPYKHPWMA